ncbi:MAG: helix-turn-helix domain-containing protein [Acutalibacteraceae bacterium]
MFLIFRLDRSCRVQYQSEVICTLYTAISEVCRVNRNFMNHKRGVLMTFGKKVKQLRLVQTFLRASWLKRRAFLRSLYTYEQTGTMPRSGNMRKIADALHVSVSYLLDEEETDLQKNVDQDIFIANVKNEYGYKGVREANAILSRASALFAGGELDDAAKDLFFQSLMEVYLESKEEARAKFTPKRVRRSRKTRKE